MVPSSLPHADEPQDLSALVSSLEGNCIVSWLYLMSSPLTQCLDSLRVSRVSILVLHADGY